ncbi:class I SAM-dependent methyltransferase [Mycobacterium yunnanensis]|uniref:Class I SAM-dependent methyltransferase n=1 Tax=Mycobacterium yunnanensis TaxID=368477 RepID=A0A9X3BYF2_9MYCO|nr:class I SAM-dependent methyltransferase [Mycobacterium yunnanensis]MCV7419048.1 class I SAM-dependent methyltransferase [Mycobacterium yunnanensis]
MTPPDTAQRSLEHWSEAGRAEMEAFYALATEDYRQLVAARDWNADLASHAVGGRVRLLDVACGSGKFPTALLAGGLATAPVIEVDLLDPSAFSIAEARSTLAPPFVAAGEHEVLLQDFSGSGYDVAWATHALYALPPAELAAGVAKMVASLRPGGFGVVAQASSRSHYLTFYDAYRESFAPDATPYTDAEGVAAALRDAGAPVEVQLLSYRTGTSDRTVAEGFLQRCAFDDTVTLEQMEASDALGRYLSGCRGPDGAYAFQHEAHLITWQQP